MPNRLVSTGPWEHVLPTVDRYGVTMFHHAPSGVFFSLGDDGFRATATHRYDERARDVSVRYSAGSSAIVSVYVHPFPPPRSVAVFDELFNAATADMLSKMASTSLVEEYRTAFAHASANSVLGRRCEALGSIPVVAKEFDLMFVELFIYRRWILKLRGTCRSTFRPELERFVASWLAASAFGIE